LKEGQTIEEIRQILNNASNIILNGNIRINWYLFIKDLNVNQQFLFLKK
jgi:hypothetical protein